jgi:sterol desaturase/sphingolipid hydroxylase (fatty acid hydroxylase superfamily)
MQDWVCYGLAVCLILALRAAGKLAWPYLPVLGDYGPQYCIAALGYLVSAGYLAFFYLVYKRTICLEKYRISPAAWPWQDQETWPAYARRTAAVVILNDFVLGPLVLFLGRDLPEYRVDGESFPGLAEMAPHMLCLLLVENVVFYCLHRLMHAGWAYPLVHKLHHEHSVTWVLTAHYSHPVEMLLTGFLPSLLGIKLLGRRLHFFTVLVFLLFRNCEAYEGHCGYELPWTPIYSFPLSITSGYHNFHHSQNVGNFGSNLRLFDSLLGTNTAYLEWLNHEKED